MPQPKFAVQHFIACSGVSWYGRAGPKPPYTLEEVGFEFPVERDAEPPFDFSELWLYVRLYRTNSTVGDRRFSIGIYRVMPDGTERLIRIQKGQSITVRNPNRIVYERVWVLRDVKFPALGSYTIRLLCRYRKWSQWTTRSIATEYIEVWRKP